MIMLKPTAIKRITALAVLLTSMALPAHAQYIEYMPLVAEGPGMQLLQDSGNKQKQAIISREEAMQRALGQYPGKVLSVKLRRGGDFYAVKIINKGRVRVVSVPAQR